MTCQCLYSICIRCGAGSGCKKEWSFCMGGVHLYSSSTSGANIGWRATGGKHAENLTVQNANTHSWLASTSKHLPCQQHAARDSCHIIVCSSCVLALVAIDYQTACLLQLLTRLTVVSLLHACATTALASCIVNNFAAAWARRVNQH